MSDFFAFKLFLRVAQSGSFTRAGGELCLSQPSVSRTIASLEEEVDVPLPVRNTRVVILTKSGVDYLASIEPMFKGFEVAQQAARGTEEKTRVQRIGAPTSIAIREVISRLAEFIVRLRDSLWIIWPKAGAMYKRSSIQGFLPC